MGYARHDTGDAGELLAVKFLELQGYLVVDRNVRTRRGEIDIVAREKGALVFVEVKTRRSAAFGEPAEAVTREKARKLALAAAEYLYGNLLTDETVRCDVVSVLLENPERPQVELLRNAVALGDYLQG